jgi:hypothetical protein
MPQLWSSASSPIEKRRQTRTSIGHTAHHAQITLLDSDYLRTTLHDTAHCILVWVTVLDRFSIEDVGADRPTSYV